MSTQLQPRIAPLPMPDASPDYFAEAAARLRETARAVGSAPYWRLKWLGWNEVARYDATEPGVTGRMETDALMFEKAKYRVRRAFVEGTTYALLILPTCVHIREAEGAELADDAEMWGAC